MAKAFAKVSTPEYRRNSAKWNEFDLLMRGGDDLIAKLPQSSREDATAYDDRKSFAVDLANWPNKIQKQQDILSQGKIAAESTDAKIDDLMNVNDPQSAGVTGDGQGFVDFMINRVTREALSFGRMYVVGDRNPIPDGATQAQADAARPPYLYTLPPLQVRAVKYKPGATREIEQCLTVLSGVKERDEYGFVSSEELKYTLWTPTEIIVQNSKGEQIDAYPNSLGMVPIVEVELTDSLLRDMFRPTLRLLANYSFAAKGAANMILGLPVMFTDISLDDLNVEVGKGLRLNPNDKFEIHNTPESGVNLNLDMVKNMEDHINNLLNRRIYSMSAGAVQQSGVSKKMDQLGQENFSQYLAAEIKRYAGPIVNLLGAYYGSPDVDMTLKAPNEFVFNDRVEDRNDARYFTVEFDPQTKQQFISAYRRSRKLSGLEEDMTPEEVEADNKQLEEKAEELFGEKEPEAPPMQIIPEEDTGDETTGPTSGVEGDENAIAQAGA